MPSDRVTCPGDADYQADDELREALMVGGIERSPQIGVHERVCERVLSALLAKRVLEPGQRTWQTGDQGGRRPGHRDHVQRDGSWPPPGEIAAGQEVQKEAEVCDDDEQRQPAVEHPTLLPSA